MVCPCGGQLKETNWTTKDGTEKAVKTCGGCGRRYEAHHKNGKKIYEQG